MPQIMPHSWTAVSIMWVVWFIIMTISTMTEIHVFKVFNNPHSMPMFNYMITM